MTRRLSPACAWVLAILLALAAACGRGGESRPAVADSIGAQRSALVLLFRTRERAGRLVLWSDPRERGPVLQALGLADAHAGSRLARDAGLGVPATTVGAADMERLFEAHPDGWAAFFRRHPGAPGLIEVAAPQPGVDARAASVVVGRSCGEQCRHAWRVAVRRAPDGNWRAVNAVPLRVRDR